MDTFKDKISFDRMEAQENCPWKVWQNLTSPEVRAPATRRPAR